MEGLLTAFYKAIDDFTSKKHDVLSLTNRQFEPDFIELNAAVSDVETRLQQFINRSFDVSPSIEESIKLLHRFETVLLVRTTSLDLATVAVLSWGVVTTVYLHHEGV